MFKTISSISTVESISISLWLSISIALSISITAIAKSVSMAVAKRRVAKLAITMSYRISTVSKTISSISTIESIGISLWLSISITLSNSIGTIAKTISMAIAKRRVAEMAITMSQRISAMSKSIS